ncbi:hypothetical protein [Flavobacterium sp.]|uniref:hypothetical protein n=1 Tax=Flavobacterium sp. TaxID=239 RepID=UPI0037507CCA
MKRIILVSMYVIASIVMLSCTDDTTQTTPSNNKVRVVADEPGDPIIIPPTKP